MRGETGIRTPDTLLTYTRFPGVPLQPLEHLSLTDYSDVAIHVLRFSVTKIPFFIYSNVLIGQKVCIMGPFFTFWTQHFQFI